MIKYVIDTNIVFSIIHSPDNRMSETFFIAEEYDLQFVAPEYLQLEIDRHRSKLLERTGLDDHDLDRLITIVYRKIEFFQDRIIPIDSYVRASQLVRDVDPLDVPFVALSVYLDLPLYTGDNKLYRGLLQKGYTAVVNFDDLKLKHNL